MILDVRLSHVVPAGRTDASQQELTLLRREGRKGVLYLVATFTQLKSSVKLRLVELSFMVLATERAAADDLDLAVRHWLSPLL